MVASGESIEFVTATGVLSTVLTDPNSDGNFVMTLTSPNDNTTYSDFVSSTAGDVGTAGLVPAPAAGTQGGTYYLNGNKSFTVPPDTTYDVMGAGNSYAAGLVLAGNATPGGAFLRKDGAWEVPPSTDTGIPAIITIANGTLTFANSNVTETTLRTKIGAGTSNLALGNSSTTALAGNTTTISATQTADITANNDKVTDSGIPAIIVDDAAGNMSFGNANVTATTVRAQIGAGTGDGDGDVTLTGTQTLTNKTLTTPVIDRISPSAGLLQIDGISTGSIDGGIKLMCSAGSHGQTLKSQPHGSSADNTLLLPDGTGTSTLVSNVSASALTNKTGSNSQWTNDEGYTTNTGTTTADNSQEFTNKTGSNSQWTNDEGYTTNTGTTTAGNTQTFTNKSGSNSQWTNDESYSTTTGTVTPSSTDTFTNKSGSNSQWTNDEGYTTNTGTTTASNTQTFTSKSGSNSQWTNDEGYSTTTGTVTPSSTDTFTNKSGNISMWTNDSGYTTNTGTTTATNTQTFTNKSGNISQWTNDSGYITSYSEADTLQSVTARGASSSIATNFTGGLTINGSGTGAYLYVVGNAGGSATLTNTQGMAFAYNRSNGSAENDLIFNPGSVTSTVNNIKYFAIVNQYMDSNNSNARSTEVNVAKFYGNGDMDITGTFTAAGNVVAYSDERLKSNVKTLDGSKVYEMRGVSFDKDGEKGSGVIAQEMEKVAPELVKDGEYKGVAYGNISGYLIEAIKELKQEIEELKSSKCNCKCSK